MADRPPLRLAVVGLRFGTAICRELAAGAGPVRLAGVCDLDRQRAELLGREHGVPAYAGLDEVLADPRVDAIGLFTPPEGRAGLISRCIRAGKDVMTTKPFERNAAAAAAVLAEADKLGRVVHANSPAPVPGEDLAVIARWREQHDLGDLVALRGEVWASYREFADGSWYDDPVRCPVAPLYRLGIYLLNDLLHLGGPVRRIQVETSRLYTGRPTADQAEALLRFASGALGSIYASFCVEDGDHYRNALTLRFARGTIYRNVGVERGHARNELALVQGGAGGRTRVERVGAAHLTGDYRWDVFADAVHLRLPLPRATVATIVEGVRILNAMAEAERSHLPVTLDGSLA